MKKLLNTVLVIIELFVFVSAIAGAYALIWLEGMGMPLSFLSDSPFRSFVVPGIILGLVVGGGSLFAAIASIARWRVRPEAVAVSGFGLIIWIFTEMYIIKAVNWMQILYFGLGTLILVFLILLQKLEIRNLKRL